MKTPLHILHLEDDANDAALVQTALKEGGIECTTTRVQTQEDFIAELDHGDVDLILWDYSLPEFDGLSALKIAHAGQPHLPVILVSGTLGEELAIDSLRCGATDYVLKERLFRLVPAVRRAMQEVEERAERKRLEEQFIEAQKMEGIGQLAGGVAHDFNNILSVIIGYSDLITSDVSKDSPLHNYAEEIRQATRRAAGLTQQLLVFSRKQTVQAVVLDLNEVVESIEKMLRRLIDDNVEMIIAPKKRIGHIKTDSGYIGQVLMNLVVNARDAMPNGGKITIATENVRLDENYTKTHAGSVPGDYVMLSVSDTGSGMTEEVKAQVFTAFFTTKPLGKGTGLGLSTCQTIMQHCGGHIDVSSEVDKGTAFRFYFPQVDQPLETPTRSVLTGPLPRGSETILVVEDEPAVRHLARGILELQGYNVITASNGHDALHVVRSRKGEPIHLVITDVIMPLMSGTVMAEWLKSSYPDLKILFTSGYTDDAIASHGVLDAGVEFLPKPYSRSTLVRKVRDLLDDGLPPDPRNGKGH